MTRPPRLFLAIYSLFSLSTLALSASPTSFCKCTCFTNSTIIPLDAPITVRPKTALLFPRSGWAENEEDAQEPVPHPAPEEGEPKDDEGEGKDKDSDKEQEDDKQDDPKDDDGKEKIKDPKKGEDGQDRKEYRAGNCADCNRQFCLDYNLPICKNAGMEDVFTTCFQRDSRKDEAVVFIFIFATAGLLIWAAIKPWVWQWVDTARERRSYIPVSGND